MIELLLELLQLKGGFLFALGMALLRFVYVEIG
jgi:hypothetical protein